MSYRKRPLAKERARDQTRELFDRVGRLERNSGFSSAVSFGPSIQVGDVTIGVTIGPGNERQLQFTNTLTGEAVGMPLDFRARAASSSTDHNVVAGAMAALDTANLRLSVPIPAGVAGLVDVELTATIPLVSATGDARIGWLRNGLALTTRAVVLAGVAVPVAFTYRDLAPGAGTYNYDLGAFVTAASVDVGDGAVGAIEITAALVPAAS